MDALKVARLLVVDGNIRAQSSNAQDDWQERILAICALFSDNKPEGDCPELLFVQPVNKDFIGVVRAQGYPLMYYFIIVSRELYDFVHDPFLIAERFPAEWNLRGSIPELEWQPEPWQPRTIDQLTEVFRTGDTPFLLGGAQVLVDGGSIRLRGDAPALKTMRDLWLFLPDSVRRIVWPATLAFNNQLGFRLVGLAPSNRKNTPGMLDEEGVRDYPEGVYESSLHLALQARDESSLQKLLNRRDGSATLRLAFLILILLMVTFILANIIGRMGAP